MVTAGPGMVHLIQAQPGNGLAKSTHCPGASEHFHAHAIVYLHTLARTHTCIHTFIGDVVNASGLQSIILIDGLKKTAQVTAL